ncbi:MAG: ABC transporter ATP-binding protein [Limisphaera sp.]|nr:MAG: ABC transporter ATP-binding protein [Limisphaera sp.]
MLEVRELTVCAGTFRLRAVSLRVEPGQCHAVLGPSGCGKTTLLHGVLGLRPVESGSVTLNGREITRWPVERRGMGYVPQELGLFPHLTVRENIRYGLEARGCRGAEWERWVEELVEVTGLGGLLERRPNQLSGGERQRVALARALAFRPKLVLLDEPFAALNESLRRELWWLLRTLQHRHGLTVLLVTHDLAEAYVLADRVTVLLEGRVIQQGDKAAVYGRPAAPAVAQFLGVETLQPGRVIAVGQGLVTVEVGRARLQALGDAQPGESVLVSIRAEDVLLAGEAGGGSSARNRLPARVLRVDPAHPLWRVELDAGFPLTALVTRPACEELGLVPGRAVQAWIKAPAVHLIRAEACGRSESGLFRTGGGALFSKGPDG